MGTGGGRGAARRGGDSLGGGSRSPDLSESCSTGEIGQQRRTRHDFRAGRSRQNARDMLMWDLALNLLDHRDPRQVERRVSEGSGQARATLRGHSAGEEKMRLFEKHLVGSCWAPAPDTLCPGEFADAAGPRCLAVLHGIAGYLKRSVQNKGYLLLVKTRALRAHYRQTLDQGRGRVEPRSGHCLVAEPDVVVDRPGLSGAERGCASWHLQLPSER